MKFRGLHLICPIHEIDHLCQPLWSCRSRSQSSSIRRSMIRTRNGCGIRHRVLIVLASYCLMLSIGWGARVQLHLLASHCPLHTVISSAPWLVKLPSQSSGSAHLCLWRSTIDLCYYWKLTLQKWRGMQRPSRRTAFMCAIDSDRITFHS